MEWKHTYFTPAKKVAKIESLSLVLTGTAFQQSVWQVMLKIPKGKALSYGDVARRIGNPRAARAVGMACGANPVAYLVPCHRVVAANGIGGFGSGLEIKKKLLKTEGYL
jgi:O-6-methylguanine DNA methyltransferase